MNLLQIYLGLGLWTWVSINILHFDSLIKRTALGTVISLVMMVTLWPLLFGALMFAHLTEEPTDEQP